MILASNTKSVGFRDLNSSEVEAVSGGWDNRNNTNPDPAQEWEWKGTITWLGNQILEWGVGKGLDSLLEDIWGEPERETQQDRAERNLSTSVDAPSDASGNFGHIGT
ncbi:MAG: hypothetical protein ACK57E_11930 [Erythrobacteraceae bacterium]|jgi:hypothetical protein